MASRKEYEMLFQLNAKLGSGYTSAFKQAKSSFDDLQAEIKELQSVQADISSYTKQQAAVERTESKLTNLQKQYDILQREIEETEGPTGSLERQSAKLEQRIGDTSNALAGQKERLNQTKSSLDNAGVSTDHLAGANADLAERVDYLRIKQQAAAESAQNFASTGVNAVEAVSQAFAAAKIYQGLEKIRDGFIAAAQASIEYESAITGVFKTVDGTDAQLEAINDGIKEMSTELPASKEEIAGVAEAAGQLGIATDNVLDFTRVMIDLGESTNLSAEDAATSLARIANITGTQASNYSRMGSVIVDLGNNFATTESEITAMSTRLAAAGKLAGLTEPEIFALAASMSSVGIEAEAGGTAMTQTLNGIEKAVAKGGDDLTEYARISKMSSEEFATAWETDAISALSAFISGLGQLDEEGESTVLVLDKLGLTGVRQSNVLKSLGLAADNLQSAVNTANTAWEENIALTNEAEKRYGTTESQLDAMSNSYDNLKVAIGDVYTPAVKEAAAVGNDALKGMTEFVEENPAVVKGLTATVGVIGTAAAGLTAFTAAAKIATVVIPAMSAAIGGVALGPVALAVAGVAALTGGVVALASAADDAIGEIGEVPPPLEEITVAADGVTDSLDGANEAMRASAEITLSTAGAAEGYISTLERMGDYASLAAEEQQEYRNVLSLLCDLVPELGEHINTTTGEIDGGITSLRGYAAAWEETAKAQAYQEFMAEASQGYNDVTKELYGNQLKLTEAQNKAAVASKGMDDNYQQLLKTLGMTDEQFKETYGSVSAIAAVHLDPEIADQVIELRDAWEGYSDELVEAENFERTYQAAVDEGIAKQGEAKQAIEEAQGAYESLEAAQSASAGAAAEGAAELSDALSTVTQNASDLVAAYKEAYTAAQESIGGQYNLWDDAAAVSATSADTMNQNLTNQAGYWQEYNQNLDTLREKTGEIEGLGDMIASFADGSEESVNAIAGMADAAENGGSKLQQMVQNWQDLQAAQSEASAALADIKTDFTNQMDELAEKAGETVDALDMSADAAKNGKATIQSFINSADSMLPSVEAAYSKIGAAAASALNSKIERATNPAARPKTTGAQAHGTRNADPGWTLVGEYGPEIVYMQGGEGVLNAAATKDMLVKIQQEELNGELHQTNIIDNRSQMAVENASAEAGDNIQVVLPPTVKNALDAPAGAATTEDATLTVETDQPMQHGSLVFDVPSVQETEAFGSDTYIGGQTLNTSIEAGYDVPGAETVGLDNGNGFESNIIRLDWPKSAYAYNEHNEPQKVEDVQAAILYGAAEPYPADADISTALPTAAPNIDEEYGGQAITAMSEQTTNAISSDNSSYGGTTEITVAPVFEISGVENATGVQAVLQQHTEDLRQMILDVVNEDRIDNMRRAY